MEKVAGLAVRVSRWIRLSALRALLWPYAKREPWNSLVPRCVTALMTNDAPRVYWASYGFKWTRNSRIASCGSGDPVCGIPTRLPLKKLFHSAPSSEKFQKRRYGREPGDGSDWPA